ncbi:M24 family metallopeptidase [Photorhabdus sp. RM71S]|uniref:M24 family metallopeptidase n=1 Tax=Photorhabdus sp. RM71S TaxID=3342824 RepID=UPI0036DB919C
MSFNYEKLSSLFKNNDLDIIIGSTKENCRYFGGFTPVVKTLNPYFGQSYVVLHKDEPEKVNIVHSIGEIDQVLDSFSNIGHVQPYGLFYREYDGKSGLTQDEIVLMEYSTVPKTIISATEALAILIKKLANGKNINKIGYDEDGLQSDIFVNIKSEFPRVFWEKISSGFRKVRHFKTKNEIELLSLSARINESAIHHVVSNVTDGTSELDVAKWFNQSLVSQGALPSLTMIKAGRHAVGGQRKQKENLTLRSGDILWFDSDAVYEGYWSDIARVYAIEKVSPEILRRYEALRNGMLAAYSFIRPGVTGKQVFEHVMETVHKSGFREYRRHHVGHGIGLEPYEHPILSPHDNTIIEEGMVLSVETPYYEFGFGALHIEDPLIVGENGNEFLTAFPVPELKIL